MRIRALIAVCALGCVARPGFAVTCQYGWSLDSQCEYDLTLPCGENAGPGSRSLHPEWTARLSASQGQPIYRLTVCPSGLSFITDALGRLAILDKNGRIQADHPLIPEVRGTVALTCNAGDQLVAVHSRYIFVFDFRAGDVTLNRRIPVQSVRLRPSKVVEANGNWIVLGALDGRNYIHVVEPNGSISHSFGEAPVPQLLSDRAARRGSLIWNPATQTVLFVTANPFGIRSYTLSGDWIGGSIAHPSFEPLRYDALSGPQPSDEVFSAFLLPSNELVAQTFRLDHSAPGTRRRRLSTFILGQDRKVEAEAVAIDGEFPGYLQGVSSEGMVYFFAGLSTGVKVSAMSLR